MPLSDLKICLKTEVTLDQISNGIFNFIEQGRTTNETAKAIDAVGRSGLTTLEKVEKTRPGDLNCTDLDVRVKYMAPSCADIADTCIDFTCGTGTPAKDTWSWDAVTVGECVSDTFTISAEDFDCECESPREQLARFFERSVRKQYKQYNKKLLTKLATGVGTMYDDANSTLTTPVDLKLFRPEGSTIVPQPLGLYALRKEYLRQAPNLPYDPVLITSSEMVDAFRFAGNFWDGNVDGKDAKNMLQSMYFDPELTAIIGSEGGGSTTQPAISMIPGSHHLVEFWDFNTEEHQMNPDGRTVYSPIRTSQTLIRQKVDIGTPFMGMPYVVDMQIEFDECDGKWGTVTYKFRKYFDLWQVPQLAFCDGDTHNYSLLWNITSANVIAADLQ